MPLLRLLLAAGVAALLAPPTSAERSVLHIVVDDLGRADLGFRTANRNQSHTPQLNMMARDGVLLDSHYVFQVCAPTRAAVLSGRYPWGVGFYYVGGDNLGLGVGYEMLPQALRRLAKAQQSKDVATFAIGKWHAGSLLKRYTPTYRGFESFFGYCACPQITPPCWLARQLRWPPSPARPGLTPCSMFVGRLQITPLLRATGPTAAREAAARAQTSQTARD